MSTPKTSPTYITPRNPAMACMNALSEIRALEDQEGKFMEPERQAQIILFHLRDYDGGRIMVWMFNGLTLSEIMRLLFSHDHDHDRHEQIHEDEQEDKKAA